ncbi:hypothetical protein PRIPAC_95459 [Pristionchus pacificus]|uniref:Uncharacterized protein n=1 Tax=Pristionchus pacificus TaxID=54126 RepID=A0A2A6D1D3_PRIPA|nr:hypothetical protein PRIPAC_95459 [Pristionchus pacificus]|eukprot:PDM84189.1 hypothetical protein PRIPAC_33212 [Pristionchus pacificus]
MDKPCYLLMCLVVIVLSGAIPEVQTKKPQPGQFIKQTTYVGTNLPMNATKLEVCIKSGPAADTCDVYKTTATFSHTSSNTHIRADSFARFFFDKVTHTSTNIFATKGNITLTLMNATHDIMGALLYSDWITEQAHKNGIILPLANNTHPAMHDMSIIEQWKETDDDSLVRDFILAAVKLEAFCDAEYYGEACMEHCPQGCPHGTCSNGICSKCEYPYHGEACDRCGENGNCEHGVCIETEIGNIMSGQCECATYYEGAQCDTLINNCTIVPCSPNGRCDETSHKCVCYGLYEGNFCEIHYSYWRSKDFITKSFFIIFILGSIKLKCSEWPKAICSSDMDEPNDNISLGAKDGNENLREN